MWIVLLLACGDAPGDGNARRDSSSPLTVDARTAPDPAHQCADNDLVGCAVKRVFDDGATVWVQATEAPAFQHTACMTSGACPATRTYSDLETTYSLPASGLSASEAAALCGTLGGTLPSLETWTRLASNDGETRYPWGDAPQCWSTRETPPLEDDDGIREACSGLMSRIQAELGVDAVDALGDLASTVAIPAVIEACGAAQDLAPRKARDTLQARLREAPRRASAVSTDCNTLDPIEVGRARPGLALATTTTGRNVGLVGMAGNVAEWVTIDGGYALAGGSWVDNQADAWLATAHHPVDDQPLVDAGVRCVWGQP